MKFYRGIPDKIQLGNMLKRHDDLVGAEPCPIGEGGKINPHATRYYHADGRITAVFHVGPLYYQTRWGTWESLRDVTTHKGNHRIIFDANKLWRVHPNYITWLENRAKLFPENRNSFVAVDSPYSSTIKTIAKATTISVGMSVDVSYPDASPETTTVDGTALRQVSTAAGWTSCVTGNGTGSNDDAIANNPRNRNAAGNYYCNRIAELFDTSGIGASSTISAATLTNTTFSSGAYAAESGLDAYVIASAPASNTAIVASDYENGFTDNTKYSDAIAYNSTTNNTAETHTLTAGGLAIINKTGVTKLGVRGDFDIDGTPAPSSADNNWLFYTADNGSNEPELSVTYTAGGGPTFTPIVTFF